MRAIALNGITLRNSALALCVVLLGLITAPGIALANPLDDARNAGLVGERPDGLVGVVPDSAPADIVSLVDSVNEARMASYRDLANKEGTSLAAVQAVAGERQIQKAVQNGWYVMDASGNWRKR